MSSQLGNLLNCCCKNKAFLTRLIEKQLNMCYLLALLGEANVQCALCSMLELNLIQETPTQKYIVFLLQTNHRGKSMYLELVQKMRHLQHFVSLPSYKHFKPVTTVSFALKLEKM